MSRFKNTPDVICFDGLPVEPGDTVWKLGGRSPIIITFVDYVDRYASGYCVETGARVCNIKPESITHHKSLDSWKSIWHTFDFIIEKQGDGIPMYETTKELCDRIQAMLDDTERGDGGFGSTGVE